MTVPVDQEREVLAHRADQIVPAAGLQTEHREIRIPVVHLAKASAGHDIALRQRQAAGILDLNGWIAREDGPEPIDVLDDGLALDALIVRRFHLRRVELARHERFEVEVGAGLFTFVFAYDLPRIAPGDSIDEGLAVGEDALHLNIAEEFAIGLGRSRWHRRSWRRRRGTTCEANQHQQDDGQMRRMGNHCHQGIFDRGELIVNHERLIRESRIEGKDGQHEDGSMADGVASFP